MADFPAQQLAPDDLGAVAGLAVSIPAAELFFSGSGGAAQILYFLMRGEDSGADLTTWVATVNPDPNGTQATIANTTPPLVGSIVAGSGAVLVSW